jgi:hypothetical protein
MLFEHTLSMHKCPSAFLVMLKRWIVVCHVTISYFSDACCLAGLSVWRVCVSFLHDFLSLARRQCQRADRFIIERQSPRWEMSTTDV